MEIEIFGVDAVDAAHFVPEISLLFPAIAGLLGGVERPSLPTDYACLLCLTVLISLLAFMTGISVFEVGVGRADTGGEFVVEYLPTFAFDVGTIFSCLIIDCTFWAA